MNADLFSEDILEGACLEWLEGLGYEKVFGPDIAPEQVGAERESFGDVVLKERLISAIDRLNPDATEEAKEDAIRRVLVFDEPSLITVNRKFHQYLRDGIPVELRQNDGSTRWISIRLFDFEDESNNDFCAVNQFTIIEGDVNRRPDIIVFVNGLPLAIFELKKTSDKDATIHTAYNHLQTYKNEITSLFHYNEICVISDGMLARTGSLTANFEWFKPWRTIDGDEIENQPRFELEVLVKGAFEKKKFLELIKGFVAYEEDRDTGSLVKILAGYHQFHAARKAVKRTLEAVSAGGDQRCGVVWHTQGSGKSYTMLFFAGQIMSHPEMKNPTIVVLTDRNDLDDQLAGQFSRCNEILREEPKQVESVSELRESLKVASGGVIFTTIQKFLPDNKGEQFPLLSERRNIVVVTDEAHRSQYDMIDGFARNIRDALPGASFIGFTGTPIETGDSNTRAVFGDYIDIYDVEQAVRDHATVPIYYESRVAKLNLREDLLKEVDAEIEEVTEGVEEDRRKKVKSKWSALEALVGDDERIKLIAKDIVSHFEDREAALFGKGMIVCMSRRICVDLYNAIIEIRPEWHNEEDDKGALKIIMTGSASDGPEWQQHIRNKKRRKALGNQFKDPKTEFKLAIVRDMWLTGFDAPCLHTLYVDKPMRGHGLMQAIARVNRVFKDKPGGLVVDYIGIGDELKKALQKYTEGGGHGKPSVPQEEAIEAMLKHFEICVGMLHGFDLDAIENGTPAERFSLLPFAQEHIISQKEGKERWLQHVNDLSKAFSLCPSSEEAKERLVLIAFFQLLRSVFLKYTRGGKSDHEIDLAVKQLVNKVVGADGEIIDVFEAAGLTKPDISILSDEFLAEVRMLPQKSVAAELLKKLLRDDIKIRFGKNVVKEQKFSEMLQNSLSKYHERAISTQEIIEELIALAKQMKKEGAPEDDPLSTEERAFYDALADHETALEAMGSDELKVIAHELVVKVRGSVGIDWHLRESARAKLRVVVKKILRQHGYPPDLELEAVKTVLMQAERLSAEWA